MSKAIRRIATLLGCVALVSVAVMLGIPVAAAASPPTKGLVAAPAGKARAVVAAINRTPEPKRPSWCYDVWLARSDPAWATWTFSHAAYGAQEECVMMDGLREFYHWTGKRWAWAGRFSGVQVPLCFFVKNYTPSLAVIKDLGCARK